MLGRSLAAIAGSGVLAIAPDATAEPARSLRVSADLVIPFATWDRVAGPGVGGSLAVAIPLGSELDVTGRVAVIPHLAVEEAPLTTRVLEAPILGGARYTAARIGRAHGFVFGEVGMVAVRTTVTVGAVADHDSVLRFASALGGGVGYRPFDLRVAAWLADLGDLDRGVGATVSLGYQALDW